MSFEKPTSEVYFMNVPFSADMKNVIDFKNKSVQEEEFKKLADKHFTNLNIIRKDRPLIIKGDFGDYYKYNYLMFKNPELDNKWWYAFIIDSNYTSSGDTEIIFEIDFWQTFQFDTDFKNYRSMIARGIVPLSKDNYKDWTQGEPIDVTSIYQGKDLYGSDTDQTTTNDWLPSIILETLSFYNSPYYDTPLFFEYTYSGQGTSENISPIFQFILPQGNWYDKLNDFIKGFQSTSVPHINDILNLRILPAWLIRSLSTNSIAHYGDVIGKHQSEVGSNINVYYRPSYLDESISKKLAIKDVGLIINNNTGSRNCKFNFNTSTLGKNYIDYTPRNKKMLGSLCRAFLLYSKNHIYNKILKPEFINGNYIEWDIKAKPNGSMWTKQLNYLQNTEIYDNIDYNLIFNCAYNGNVGLQKTLNEWNATSKLVGSSVALASDIYTLGTLGEARGFIPDRRYKTGYKSVTENGYTPLSIQESVNLQGARNSSGISIIDDGIDVVNSGISLAQALGQHTYGKSSSVDLLSYSPELMKIRGVEVTPSKADCIVIDQFLDMYGYSINEMGTIAEWKNTRSNWNYIKTVDCNLKLKGSVVYEDMMKSMFNSGVTIWHGFDKFGKYNTNRTDGVTINK